MQMLKWKINILLLILLFQVSSSYAGQVIIVAPDIFYPNGFEEIFCPDAGESLCQNRQKCEKMAGSHESILLAELSEIVYAQLGDGLRRVNESLEARQAGKTFKVKSVASPTCQNNLRIKTFYQSLIDDDFAKGVLQRHSVDMVAWGDFSSQIVTDCPKGQVCSVPVKVNWQTHRGQGGNTYFLKYIGKHSTFDSDSLRMMQQELTHDYLKVLVD